MSKDLESSRLYIESKSCKKCEFETKSEGMLRRHNVLIHAKQGTDQNVIIGFESDMKQYVNILEIMKKSLDQAKCEECDFVSHSQGKLAFHNLTTHRG